MLDDVISQSLEGFKADCRKLCENHYPTIHNRGMRDIHLGKALSRRIVSTLSAGGHYASLVQLETAEHIRLPIFHINGGQYQLYVIGHRMVSPGAGCRHALITDIQWSLEKLELSSDADFRLLLVSDHWFDRTMASKTLPSWWLGNMPVDLEAYQSQGIKLQLSDGSLSKDIEHQCSLDNGNFKLFHPLKRLKDNEVIYKYMLMSASFTLHPNNTLGND
ncbi:hypothetical protein [Veronia pacifica]|uniref:Uncharacterized protein n=1 Tax=Veronia pacifica TaxID=1080227 RepID=A0A1C3EKM6_9GAMM|nr:hypothetical protein [Veronia pacifica]ODA33779.1 hypothetical protein A8L45_09115 [Veronia pacifica]